MTPFWQAQFTFYSIEEWQQPDPNLLMIVADERPESDKERWYRQAREADSRIEKTLAALAEHEKNGVKPAFRGILL